MFRCVFRRAIALVAGAFTLGILPSDAAFAATCWQAPVDGYVTDPFREPPCPYCAGNRGLEYRVGANVQVRSVEAGVVSWAGTIAGTRYVVVRHGEGWRATYGRLAQSSLRTGDRVAHRGLIGTATESFYFGLRVGEEYRDPAPHLGQLVGRQRLVPVDGSSPRPAPPPRLRCAATP